MPLNLVTTGNTILASDVNQLVNVLQRQSGQSESGHYFIDMQTYTTGAHMMCYYPSLSRVTVPVSATVDESDQAHNTCNAAATAHLTVGGVLITTTGTATNVGGIVGGVITINY